MKTISIVIILVMLGSCVSQQEYYIRYNADGLIDTCFLIRYKKYILTGPINMGGNNALGFKRPSLGPDSLGRSDTIISLKNHETRSSNKRVKD